MSAPGYANRVAGFGTTIFAEINNLSLKHGAVNLGQGRPDFDGPQEVVEAAIDALRSGQCNQYAPGRGIPELMEGIARHAAVFYDMEVDPENGVLVTPGATEAIFCSIMGLIDPGDEVIVIEPFYDSYVPGIEMAGAKPVYVSLHPPDWVFEPEELRAAFSDRTRAIIINTPNNPTGRVFTRAELQLIADLCLQHDVIVIADEVYEHLLFDNARHIPIASLPGMFERSVTVGSAGKTFGMTGWKIGWVYGPPDLITGAWRSIQFTSFATNHPAQVGVAHGFAMGNSYYEEYQALYHGKRALMMDVLAGAGMKSILPQGTYFVMADFSDLFDGDDMAFTQHMIKEIGVSCIPPSVFFTPEHRHITRDHVRFTFCKNDDTLLRAAGRMRKLRE
ncbi:MAG: aminotransferase class I/II-fold pyridoxal phosphate-dependent enzyme [Anaerolineaceae bacterium]|nr:aminotransferase class I/II-fold pyridoxal phosphate-dependent enzyme [Anaerolineaceae bacterium]